MSLRCIAWRVLAERTAESLRRGTHVIVTGRLRHRSFETADGSRRTVLEVDVDEVGPSLRYATTTVTRATGSATPADAGSASGPGAEPAG